MGLAISDEDIEQMRQGLLSSLDRLKEVLQEFYHEVREDTEIEISPIKITFRKKGQPQ